jgi:hypothetical protein
MGIGAAYIIRDLPPLVNTSGSSVLTNGIGNIDDAQSLVIYLSTNTNVLSSLVSVEVSPRDLAGGIGTVATSTDWYPLLVNTSVLLSSGLQAIQILNPGFRSVRIRTSANSITTGTTIATATKQILF